MTEIAKTQDEYKTLPAYRDDSGVVLTRWHCTWIERLRILFTGDIYLCQHTFNQPLQPISLDTLPPEIG